MSIRLRVLAYAKIVLFVCLLLGFNLSYALPFSIVPAAGTLLPNTAGNGYALAYYSVKNLSASARDNIHVRYLPPNVAQIPSSANNACANYFSLQPNQSCVLQLKITGKVDPNDPIVSHHLFVCYPGETTCAGTNYPLDVDSGSAASTIASISIPTLPGGNTIVAGQTVQLNAIATFANGQVQSVNTAVTWSSSNPLVATVTQTGLVTAVGPGSTTITVSAQGGSRRRLIILNVVINTFSILPTAGANGSISPGVITRVPSGGNQQFTITPDVGYKIDQLRVDGVVVASTPTYTFTNVVTNHSIAVTFVPSTYTIAASSSDVNGAITPSGIVTVNSGSSQTFTITPNNGYRINELRVDGVVVANVSSYTFTNVVANHTIAVSFTPITYQITASSADVNGVISPAGNVIVNSGGSQTFTLTPNNGYRINELRVDGVVVANVSSYTFTNVVANHAIAVSFTQITYQINASSADANGVISPAGIFSVNSGSNQAFTATPNSGYSVNIWSVNGATVQTGGNNYTLTNITTNSTVTVSFKVTQYTVTPTSGGNGSITPSSPQLVNSGASLTFRASPAVDYNINQWQVDGAPVQTGGGTYTLSNILTDHTVNVTFSLAPVIITVSNVNAVAHDPVTKKTYIGGGFNLVGPRIGSGVPLDSLAIISPSFPQVAGQINTAISDNNGGWYIGGTFNGVGGVSRNGVAHINFNSGNSTYTLDATFNSGSGFNNSVQALFFDNLSNKIYVGGNFTSYNGVTRNRIARLNADGSLDTTFAPALGFNNFVQALFFDGVNSVLYAGGAFTTFNGTTRNKIAAINTDGSLNTAFNPSSGFDNTVSAITFDALNNKLYVGGFFTTFNAVSRNRIVRINNDGSLDTNFTPGTGFDNSVLSLAYDSVTTKLYVGGSYANYQGTLRRALVRLNNDASYDATFAPIFTVNASVIAMILDRPNSKLYVGGGITTINGVSRLNYARLNTDGTVDGAYTTGIGFNASVLALGYDAINDRVYTGGVVQLVLYKGTPTQGFIRINESGTLDTGFSPGIMDGGVSALALDAANSKIYVGGSFSTVGGTSRNRIARFNNDGTLDSTFNPGTGFNGSITALVYDPLTSKLYVGGTFTTFDSVTRINLARLNGNGSLDTTFAAAGAGFSGSVLSLAFDNVNTKIYAGGNFASYDGNSKICIVRLNNNGTFDAAFAGSGFNNTVTSLAFDSVINKVYVGGNFTQYNGASQNRLVRINANGSVDSAFNVGSGSNGPVNSIALDAVNSKVYIGGGFTNYSGTARVFIARLGTNGLLDSGFNPVASGSVQSFSLTNDSTIYAGGLFNSIGLLPISYIAKIPT